MNEKMSGPVIICLSLFLIANLALAADRVFKHERLEDALREFVDEWDRDHQLNSTSTETTESTTSESPDYEGNTTMPESAFPIGLPSRNCSECVNHEETRSKRLDAIKVMILSKLGLSKAPNVTRKALPRIPPLKDFWPGFMGMQSDSPASVPDQEFPFEGSSSFVPGPVYGDDDDHFHVETEKVISFAEEPLSIWNIPKEMKCKYFKFSPNVYNSHIVKAHLWVYLRPKNRTHRDSPAKVVIYQVAKDHQTGRGHNLLQVRTKKVEFNSRRGAWVTIDIRKLVAQWFRHPSENLGLVIHSYDSEGQELTIVESHDFENTMVPFIEIRVENNHHRRTKRMIGLNCEENSNEVRCCRYPLTVDFEEFGWDWIIAPKRYEANYCSGECPYVFLQKYAHTHLVQQANPQGSAGPCCAPRKMSSISMLYFNEQHNIIYGMLPGMVVERCGCS